MTPAELTAEKAKLAKLQDAYDALISGEKSAEFRYQDMSEKFFQPDIAKLEDRIARLSRQIAMAEGRGGGAIFVGIGS